MAGSLARPRRIIGRRGVARGQVREAMAANDGTIRWGIIGCGAVTEVKSGPAYRHTPGFAVSAVMRRDLEKAADYAHRHGVPRWTDDADDIIRADDVDAVYIATPPDSHLHYALRVAAAGKPCCVEKPMARTPEECARMNAAFDEAGVPLFVAYYRRSLPRFEQVAAWLREGRIGPVRHAHWAFSRPPKPDDLAGRSGWRTDPAQAGGGYFVDLASHGLDLLMHLLGDIEDIAGMTLNQQGLYTAEDAVAAHWRFAAQADGSRALGSGFWNFAADHRRDAVEIIGRDGAIRFSVFDDAPLVLERDGEATACVVANPPHIQSPHVANIARHLRGETVHPSTGATAARTTEVMARVLAG